MGDGVETCDVSGCERILALNVGMRKTRLNRFIDSLLPARAAHPEAYSSELHRDP